MFIISWTTRWSNFCAAASGLIWTCEVIVVLLIFMAWSDSTGCGWRSLGIGFWLVLICHEIISLYKWWLFVANLITVLCTTRVLVCTWRRYIFGMTYLQISLLLLLICSYNYLLLVSSHIYSTITRRLLPCFILLTGRPNCWSIHRKQGLGLLLWGRSSSLATLRSSIAWMELLLLLLLHLSQIFLVLCDLRCTGTLWSSFENWCDISFHLDCIFLINVVILLFHRFLFVQQVLLLGVFLRNL